MDAIGYIRISKKDQSVHSIDYQEKNIRDYCEYNHIVLESVFVDDGASSYTFDRPDYKALENFIKEHKGKVKYLIVLDHDRFSRNLPEALQKIDQLQKKYGLKVISTSEPLDIDTSDPSVFLLRAFKYLIANQELLTIRRRAKMSARHAQESGRYLNKAPYAYINGRQKDGKMILVVDETKAYIVQKIFRDYLAGVPRYLIHQEIRDLGFPQSGNGAIFRILINPLYAGLVRVVAHGKNPEKFVKAIHEPIISDTQYWRVQDMLGLTKRAMKSQPKAEFPLKGILKSPCCGQSLTAGWSKGKNKYYLYYRCIKHSNVNISGAVLHEKFTKLLINLNFTQEAIDEIVEEVKSGLKGMLVVRDKELKIILEQLVKVEEKIEGAEEKVLDDTINRATYKKWMKKYFAEQAQLLDRKDELEVDLEDFINQETLVLPYLLNLPKIFEDASINQQHAILNEVFKQGLTFRDGMFRTPWIHPEFRHNLQRLKELGLLEVEQPYDNSNGISYCGEGGIRTLDTLLKYTHFPGVLFRPLRHLSFLLYNLFFF
jgi:site-specific DNA recombinase